MTPTPIIFINAMDAMEGIESYMPRIRNSTGSGSGAIIGAIAQLASNLAGGGGGGPPSGGPISVQRDYVASSGKARRSGLLTRMKKKQRRKYRRIRRIKKFRRRKFRRAVKKVLAAPYHLTTYMSAGRSWKVGTNTQGSLLIPIYSYRGSNTITASDTAAGAPSLGSKVMYNGMASLIKGYLDNNVFYPNGAASNASQAQWWFKTQKATLDLTMSNTGSAADTNPGSTAFKVEYELYYITFKKMTPDATATNSLGALQDFADNSEQALGNNTLSSATVNDINHVPWLAPFNKKYYKAKLIGRGYLPNTQSQRFHFSYKPKVLFNRDQWARDNATDLYDHMYKPKASAFIAIQYRGVPSAALIGGYPPCRLTVNCNWVQYSVTHNTGQPHGKGCFQLVADDFA